MTLRSAVAFNMLDMIGVGPFITLPLLLSAMGGPQAMLGWILGALLAVCDGLVWAELGAAMPAAGGTYHFLRAIYPGRMGSLLSFLFLFQLLFSAPLSVASGSIGLSQYATFLAPQLAAHTHHLTSRILLGPSTLVAMGAVALAVLCLYRSLASLRTLSYILWTTVILTIAWILATALLHGHLAQALTFPPNAFQLTPGFFLGLGSAMLIASYDFWGYYNVTFLGAEVQDPSRTIPRAILLSIALVAVLYLVLNLSVLTVLPWQPLLNLQNLPARQSLISLFIETAYSCSLGPHRAYLLGKLAAILIMITAFSSMFSLLLGYSRIPYAAAASHDHGRPAFFAPFARLHPTRHFPHISLLTLGGTAALFCLFRLQDVIAALVVIRILLQFLLQHIGVLYLRRTQPTLPRPFRLWLYPLPPMAALAGFTYILLARPNFYRELLLAGVVSAAGVATFYLRNHLGRTGPSTIPPGA